MTSSTVDNRIPIEYSDVLDIRFSDLDSYGHVNSKHYVDLVSTSRLNFMAKEMQTKISEVTEKGIGFFMTKSTINYRRPITGLRKVRSRSHVQEIRERKTLIIPFSVTAVDDEGIFCDGVLEFAIIDLTTNRSTPAPNWILDLFFKSKAVE